MKQIWSKFLSGAITLACAGAAHAYVIDFENADASGLQIPPYLLDGDYLVQGNYVVQAVNSTNHDPSFDGSLVGALVNASDPNSCLDGSCPTGDSTSYLGIYNNGYAHVFGLGTLTLSSFDATFIPPAGVALPSTTVALLGVEADRADGSYAVGIFGLDGPDAATGVTSFASYAVSDAAIVDGTGTLTSGNVTDLYFYVYYCGTSANCEPFTADKVQFAIDNIAVNVPVVPEPAEWMLMTLGLGAVGGLARRRRPV